MQFAAACAAGKSSFTAVVLAEAGERLLRLRAVRLWNLVVTTEQSSLLQQALAANVALAVAAGNHISASLGHITYWPRLLQRGRSWSTITLSTSEKKRCKTQPPATVPASLQHYTQGVCGGTLMQPPRMHAQLT